MKLYADFGSPGIPNAQNKNAAMRFAVEKLPKDHYNTLRTLMLHLHRVTQHASVNLMTSQNLGVVFGRKPILCTNSNHQRGIYADRWQLR